LLHVYIFERSRTLFGCYSALVFKSRLNYALLSRRLKAQSELICNRYLGILLDIFYPLEFSSIYCQSKRALSADFISIRSTIPVPSRVISFKMACLLRVTSGFYVSRDRYGSTLFSEGTGIVEYPSEIFHGLDEVT
jgi:hypothetical protein